MFSSCEGLINGLHLRSRLVRRLGFRLWKNRALTQAKSLIANIDYEDPGFKDSVVPAIVLSSFVDPMDFYILTYLFRHKDLTFVSPRRLPEHKIIRRLQAMNHILYLESVNFGFFRGLMRTLRDYNRSVVVSPHAAERYAEYLPVDPVVVVRISMAANAPIVPVKMKRRSDSKYEVLVGKKIYISPRDPEFHDVFFKTRGARKFRNLPREDLTLVGQRIFSKIGY